jgi:hypothetical protein
MDYIKDFDKTLNTALSQFVKKPTIVRGVVHLFIILYAAHIAPQLPRRVRVLFDNNYFKLFIFSLILWTAQFSPSTSLLIAIAFMVTINLSTKGTAWEFLENTDPTSAPTAPTKEIAIDAASSVLQSQQESTPVVNTVAQNPETIVIQPTVIQTPQGPAVINPSVVVAPAVVSSPSGETVMVRPDVTLVQPSAQQAPASTLPSIDAPAPSPAPVPAPAAQKSPQSEPAGCFPIRRYDMSKVSPLSNDNYMSL